MFRYPMSLRSALFGVGCWILPLTGGVLAGNGAPDPLRPFPQAGACHGHSLRPGGWTQQQLNDAVKDYYFYWKKTYLKPSVKVPGDWKVDFDGSGRTVSEAIGYGMLITVMMAGADADAKGCFDGLDRFRKRYPSCIDHALMCWQIPPDEKKTKDDCATDGDLDMALALLMAGEQWGDSSYLKEAKVLLDAISSSLVRPDASLRLGDWDTEDTEQKKTRPSDFMPTHFRVFRSATGNPLWERVEERCYQILDQLQCHASVKTGLVPDFAVEKEGAWVPVKGRVLEGKHDGDFSYNACRVPWRIGWAAENLGDERAIGFLDRMMDWVTTHEKEPKDFKPGYSLEGGAIGGKKYESACFISPTGVAAMTTGRQLWLDQTFSFAIKSRDGYFEDTVNLLCLLVMTGNAWLPMAKAPF